MNTENFTPAKYPGEDLWLPQIFTWHTELVEAYNKFEPVKIKNFDINVYRDQQIMKDYLQIRFTEELTEATADFDNMNHFKEEITDAFNFLLAAYIIYGYKVEDVPKWNILKARYDYRNYSFSDFEKVSIKQNCWGLVQGVGNACNCLKNRPWKRSQYLVDIIVFEKHFKDIWLRFEELLDFLGLGKVDLFEQYNLKWQVNMFRLRSGY